MPTRGKCRDLSGYVEARYDYEPEGGLAVASTLKNDGLRYSRKQSENTFSVGVNVRTCFLCGNKKSRSELENRRICGAMSLVCIGGCATKQPPAGSVKEA
jgi:hypothetical protein